MYESDITKFLREMKERDSRVEDGQRQGRFLLWDRAQDAEFGREADESRVPQMPYVYYQNDNA